MTSYQKTWATVMTIFLISFFSLLIWAALTGDNDLTITQAIQNADTTNVTSIVIYPTYPANENLKRHAIIINDKKEIHNLLESIKTLTEKSCPRAYETFWDRTLI